MNKFYTRIQKSNFIEYFILSLIILLSLLVRLYKIDNPLADWHSWRQADTASVTRIYLEKGINLLKPRYYDISSIQTGYFNPQGFRFVEFPIFNLLHLLILRLIPFLSLEAAGRFVSIIAALLSSVVLYLLGKKLFNKWVGLGSAFFYGFLPFNVYFTRVILPEPLAVSFSLLGLYFFVEFVSSENKILLFLSAIFFSLAMLVKPFAIFYGIPVFFLSLKKYGLKRIFTDIPLLLSLDIVLVPVFLWRAWMGKTEYLVGIPHINWAFNGDNIRFRPAFWRWLFGERIGKMILGIWGVFPFVFGFLENSSIFLLSFLLGMFLYLSVIASANVRHDYYQTFIVPVIVLVLACGVNSIWNTRKFNLWLARSSLIFFLVMMFGISLYEVRGFYAINHPEIIEAGKVANQILPKDALVIAPYNGDTTFLYHTRRFGWPVVNGSIESMIDRGADYYISVNKSDSDTQNFIKKFETVREETNFVILDLKKPIFQ